MEEVDVMLPGADPIMANIIRANEQYEVVILCSKEYVSTGCYYAQYGIKPPSVHHPKPSVILMNVVSETSDTDLIPKPLMICQCEHCGRESSSMKKCSECKFIRYCNKEHQKLDWKEHKKYCKLLKVCVEFDDGCAYIISGIVDIVQS